MQKKSIVARMTIHHTNGKRTIVEVPEDATFSEFYHFYLQEGKRWSTKKQIRVANRNTGLLSLNAHLQTPGLEAVKAQALRWGREIESIKVRVIRKKAYRRLLTTAPDQLGMTKVRTQTDGRIPAFHMGFLPVMAAPEKAGVA